MLRWGLVAAQGQENQGPALLCPGLSTREGFLVDVEGPAPRRGSSGKSPLTGVAIYSFCLEKV